ncbi:hypothetical protein KY289_015378 [Solanum tuberosum]|nr:hypothetical protein KY289_015378 [Solanum tuberosum]
MRPAGLALKPTRTPRQASQQGLLLPPTQEGLPVRPTHTPLARLAARPNPPPLLQVGLAARLAPHYHRRPRPGPTPLPLASLGRGLPPADLAQGSPLSTPGKPRLEAHPSTQEGLTLRPTPPPLAGLGQDSPFPQVGLARGPPPPL